MVFSKGLEKASFLNNCFFKYFCKRSETENSVDSSSNFSVTNEKETSTIELHKNNTLKDGLPSLVEGMPTHLYTEFEIHNELLTQQDFQDDFQMSIKCSHTHPFLFPHVIGSSESLNYSAKLRSQESFSKPLSKLSHSSDVTSPAVTGCENFWIWAAEQIEMMEQQYNEVKRLLADEYLLEAHVAYLVLMERLDNFLKVGNIHILCLIRPKGYLKKNPTDPTYHVEVGGSDILKSFTGSHNFEKDLISSKSGRIVTAFGRNLSLLKFPWPTLHRFTFSKLLDGPLKHHCPQCREENTIEKDHVSNFDNDDCIACCLRRRCSTDQSSLGLGILAEPITLCPLSSQSNSSNLKMSGCFQGSFLSDLNPTALMDLEEPSMLRGTFNTDSDQHGRIGRLLIHRSVWLLGEFPAIIYAIRPPCESQLTSSQASSAGFVHSECNKPLHLPILSPELPNNIDDKDLQLPVDVQIVIIHIQPQADSSFYKKCDSTNSLHDLPSSNHFQEANANNVFNSNIFRSSLHFSTPLNFLSEVSHSESVSRLYIFLEKLVNNGSLHRLRMQYYQSKRALVLLDSIENGIKKKTWNHIITSDYKATWNLTSDGKAMCMIEGTMKTPLFRCLSIINESDLHKDWLPFVSESKKLYQLSLFTQILRQRTKFPWPLQDRESVLVGCAIDGLRLPTPCVIMNGESVPEDAVSIFGYPLTTPQRDLIRMRVNLFTFQLTPDTSNPQCTMAKLLVLLDPKISFVPKSVQTFIARQSATRLFTNMQHLCKAFEKSIYAERVLNNPQVYNVVKKRLAEYYSKTSI